MTISNTLRILRSTTALARPTGRQPGELYFNDADDRFGVVKIDGSTIDLGWPEPPDDAVLYGRLMDTAPNALGGWVPAQLPIAEYDADLNLIVTNPSVYASYSLGSAATNVPADVTAPIGDHLIHMGTTGNRGIQQYFARSLSPPETYIRRKHGGTWNAWERMLRATELAASHPEPPREWLLEDITGAIPTSSTGLITVDNGSMSAITSVQVGIASTNGQRMRRYLEHLRAGDVLYVGAVDLSLPGAYYTVEGTPGFTSSIITIAVKSLIGSGTVAVGTTLFLHTSKVSGAALSEPTDDDTLYGRYRKAGNAVGTWEPAQEALTLYDGDLDLIPSTPVSFASFSIGAAATNGPTGAAVDDALTHIGTGTNTAVQYYTVRDTDPPELHIRRKDAGVWGAWDTVGADPVLDNLQYAFLDALGTVPAAGQISFDNADLLLATRIKVANDDLTVSKTRRIFSHLVAGDMIFVGARDSPATGVYFELTSPASYSSGASTISVKSRNGASGTFAAGDVFRVLVMAQTGRVAQSDTPPVAPVKGDMWFATIFPVGMFIWHESDSGGFEWVAI